MQTLRQIVTIDEARCTGCGECILACAESAIALIDGKARLLGESLCDGFGACLGKCPEDAIKIEEREAEAFDEEAVSSRLASLWIDGAAAKAEPACPASRVATFAESKRAPDSAPDVPTSDPPISQWPIKLNLVPPDAPFLQNADVTLMADCVPFACGDGYRKYVSNRALLIGCPKFDNYDFALSRLTEILHRSNVQSLTVVHMEIPCCAGYWRLGRQACAALNKIIPLRQVVVGIRGETRQEEL